MAEASSGEIAPYGPLDADCCLLFESKFERVQFSYCDFLLTPGKESAGEPLHKNQSREVYTSVLFVPLAHVPE